MNTTLLNSLPQKSFAKYVLAIVVCALIISYIDSQLPQGLSIGGSYVILVLIGLMSKNSLLITIGGAVGTVLTLEGFYVSEGESALWIVWTNRLLAIFIIWVVALFSLGQIKFLKEQEESEKIKEAYKLLKKETSHSTLLKEISIISNSSDSVEEVLKQAMKMICKFKGLSVAHVFLNQGGGVALLSSSKLWVLDDWEAFKEFKENTEARDFSPGKGLPGRVLAEKKSIMIKDLKRNSNFLRNKIVHKNGLQSGFAFPVFIGPKIIAVMEFFSKELLVEEAKFTELTEKLGLLLGRPFERDHAGLRKEEYEEHLRRLYTRMKAVRKEEGSLGDSEIHNKLQ